MGAPAGFEFLLDPNPSREDRKARDRAVDRFNAATVPYEETRFAILTRDAAADMVVGGLDAVLYWQWLYLDTLWIEALYRRRGLGRELVVRAERHAIDQGCHSAWVDTFQAREFYETLGYARFGALEDYPSGQSRHFLRKRLVRAEGSF